MEFPEVEVLTPAEVDDIHSTALRILEEIGFKTDSSEITALFRMNGIVQKEGVMHIPSKLVEKALSSVPKTIQLFTPGGIPWRTIGEGSSLFFTGHQAVFVLDYRATDPRAAQKQDTVLFTQLANAVDDIDGIAVQVYPQEVPRHSAIIHAMESMLSYSEKPLFFAPEWKDAFLTICDLARVASGNNDLGKKPFLIAQPSPISPLFWVKGSAQCIIEAAKVGVPLAVLPMPIPGMAGPVTLAGALALQHAETLLGFVVTQLVKPGTPVIYGASWVTFDMAGGGIDIGSPEKYLLSIATPQLARHLSVPCMAAGPDTNSHILDIQNGVEKSLSAAFDFLSRTDVIVNSGMFSNALTVSLEQVLIDAEIISMLSRVRRGIEVNEDSLAIEAIKRVGIKGEFLTDPHTLSHFRNELWDTRSRLFQRDKFDKWKDSGAWDVVDLAHRRVDELLSRESQPFPGTNQLSQMAKIVAEFDRKKSNRQSD
jgi:trimethylamine--corrinoid protein Co-methyltransferase